MRKNIITAGLLSLLSAVLATTALTAQVYADGCNYNNDDRKTKDYFDNREVKMEGIGDKFKPEHGFDSLQIDDGNDDAYDDGYDDGYSDGYDDGYNAGYKAGYDKGYEDAQNGNNKKDNNRNDS